MGTNEKEINVYLLERLHALRRVKRIAQGEGATIQDIIDAIEREEADINEMLYQKPPLQIIIKFSPFQRYKFHKDKKSGFLTALFYSSCIYRIKFVFQSFHNETV